jgi:hypothetical protein
VKTNDFVIRQREMMDDFITLSLQIVLGKTGDHPPVQLAAPIMECHYLLYINHDEWGNYRLNLMKLCGTETMTVTWKSTAY